MSLLLLVLLTPLLGCVVLFFIPNSNQLLIKTISLNISIITFLLSLLLWIEFDNSTAKFQFTQNFSLVRHTNYEIHEMQNSTLNFIIGVDGISLFFIILTSFLIPICILVAWTTVKTYVKEYCICFLILETLINTVFSVLDILLFYIFFESVLIPMFIIIGVYGSRERKIRAAYQFFLYTLFGSVLMLLAILLIYFQAGTTDLEILYTTTFSETRQLLL